MANKQINLENLARDLGAAGQIFALKLIDMGASYQLWVEDLTQPPRQPALATQITATGVQVTGAAAVPGGADTNIQFNDAGAFGGDAALTWDKTNNRLLVTSADAAAFTVGRLGATNPVFQVDSSVALNATGLVVQGNAAGAGVTLRAISSGANEGITFAVNGDGNGLTPGFTFVGSGLNLVTINTNLGGIYLFNTTLFGWSPIGNSQSSSPDTALARSAPGVVAAVLGVGLIPNAWFVDGGIKRVSAQFDSVVTTLANVPGLSVNVQAGRTYSFEATLFITADVTGGSKFAVGGTATTGAVIYSIELLDFTTNVLTIADQQVALAGASGQAGTLTGRCRIKGLITVTLAGTLTIQFAQNAAGGTSSVLVGSDFIVRDNP